LGVVDLFAYEITTLCRVGTIVDAAPRYIAAAQGRQPAEITSNCVNESGNRKPTTISVQTHAPYRFDSGENYFPVFESNSRDLRVLEAGVVTNVTAFYTYMKVVRDFLRRASELDARSDPAINDESYQVWVNVIYMLFLAYEAARKSINDLIEYEPMHAENTVVILLTEIAAYGFLRKHFAKKPEEIWCRRLDLRVQEYEAIANAIYYKILHHLPGSAIHEKEWTKAAELLGELRKRCHDAGVMMNAAAATC
jgi:hypothetical protein